jgi:hypothetical protein
LHHIATSRSLAYGRRAIHGGAVERTIADGDCSAIKIVRRLIYAADSLAKANPSPSIPSKAKFSTKLQLQLFDGRDGLVVLGNRRAQGEKFVPTGIATQGSESKETTKDCGPAGNVFGGDSLKVGVATKATAGVEGETKRDGARVEAGFARFAPPGQNFRAAE